MSLDGLGRSGDLFIVGKEPGTSDPREWRLYP